MNPLEFERTLTKGDYRSPVARHLLVLHSLLYHAGVRGDALAVSEHHLREVYVATAQYTGPYEQLTPARLDADWTKRLGETLKQAARNMQASIEGLRLRPLDSEAARDARLKRQIAEERRKGLAFVKAEGRRVEKELGL